MNTNNSQTNTGSAILPSLVYIVGETSIFAYPRTDHSINWTPTFVSDFDLIFSLGLSLDRNAPTRPGQTTEEFTTRLLAAGAETFLSHSVGPIACTALDHNVLIATAFRKRSGRYDVRSIVSLDCNGPIPEQAVLAKLTEMLASSELRQEMESENLDPTSRFYDLLKASRAPAQNTLPQPEVHSGPPPFAASLN